MQPLTTESGHSQQDKPTALPIHIRGLTKTYGRFHALDAVDLAVRSGEFLTLLGPSGSGKTTLLMAIAGFNRPDAGSIRFGDSEMVLTPPHRREVGMVFQSYALFPHMSVAENIAFALKLRRVAPAECAERVAQALATVQLSGLGERRTDQLSGGQRQRVALARAFVFRPRILLMDEPLSALDKKLREQMQIELKHLHHQLGVTTVYVTHDQREALTLSDRIAVINQGKLAQVDTPEAIYNHPANAFVADFIGESAMLPLQRDASGELHFAGQPVASDGTAPDGTAPDGTVDKAAGFMLVIRPERLAVLPQEAAAPAAAMVFDGTIKDFVFQGETAFAIAAIANEHELAVRFSTGSASAATRIEPGAPIRLALKREDAIIIPRDGAP